MASGYHRTQHHRDHRRKRRNISEISKTTMIMMVTDVTMGWEPVFIARDRARKIHIRPGRRARSQADRRRSTRSAKIGRRGFRAQSGNVFQCLSVGRSVRGITRPSARTRPPANSTPTTVCTRCTTGLSAIQTGAPSAMFPCKSVIWQRIHHAMKPSGSSPVAEDDPPPLDDRTGGAGRGASCQKERQGRDGGKIGRSAVELPFAPIRSLSIRPTP